MILDTKYNFVTLSKRKFFGYEPTQIGTHKVNISDREKTLVDARNYSEYCAGMQKTRKSLWNAGEKVSSEKIVKYAETMGNTAVGKRLGYLTGILNLNLDSKTLNEMRNVLFPQ